MFTVLSAPVVLAGQLLGVAFACGLNLYATVALLGLASRFGIVSTLPPGMRGLENGVIIGIAAALYVVEFIANRVPVLDTTWEAVHTLIRPAAAGLLAFLALHDASFASQLAGAGAAAAMALAAHGSKTGVRLILANRRRFADPARRHTLARLALDIGEDVIAVAIALAALLQPAASIFVVGGSIVVLGIAGPWLWRAALLGLRAVLARTRGFFGARDWRGRDDLPRSLRSAVPVAPLGRSPARATPAAITGLPGVGSYRHGWLVFTCDGPRFVYRARFRARSRDLPPATHVTLRSGVMTDTLDVRANSGGTTHFTIYLLKDGAHAHLAAHELRSGPA